MKTCTKCGITYNDPVKYFYKNTANKTDGLRPDCKECSKRQKRQEYIKDPEKSAQRCKEYRIANKEKLASKKREYAKEYNQRPEVKARRNEYERVKAKFDPVFRIHKNIRRGVIRCLRDRPKRNSSLEYTGLDLHGLCQHLESLFLDGMSWKNYGNPNGDHTDCWHIDHIRPLSSFDFTSCGSQAELERKLKQAWHYTNLQPMWGLDNIRKGGSPL
jgi:hypothetical protein